MMKILILICLSLLWLPQVSYALCGISKDNGVDAIDSALALDRTPDARKTVILEIMNNPQFAPILRDQAELYDTIIRLTQEGKIKWLGRQLAPSEWEEDRVRLPREYGHFLAYLTGKDVGLSEDDAHRFLLQYFGAQIAVGYRRLDIMSQLKIVPMEGEAEKAEVRAIMRKRSACLAQIEERLGPSFEEYPSAVKQVFIDSISKVRDGVTFHREAIEALLAPISDPMKSSARCFLNETNNQIEADHKREKKIVEAIMREPHPGLATGGGNHEFWINTWVQMACSKNLSSGSQKLEGGPMPRPATRPGPAVDGP